MLDVRTARKIGSPRRPTAAYDSSDVAATRSGGCGFWYGLGTAHTSWNWKYLPSYVNRSSVHARRRISSVSSNRSWLSSYGMRSEEHTSELQSPCNLVCRLLLEKKKKH